MLLHLARLLLLHLQEVVVVAVVVEDILHKAAAAAFAVDQIVEEHLHEELQIAVAAAGQKEHLVASFETFFSFKNASKSKSLSL